MLLDPEHRIQGTPLRWEWPSLCLSTRHLDSPRPGAGGTGRTQPDFPNLLPASCARSLSLVLGVTCRFVLPASHPVPRPALPHAGLLTLWDWLL